MSGNAELFEAMKMFSAGVKDLQLSRSIAGANEQVQQIRASEMDEQQKRAALSQVSNDLVARMAQFGAPATTIQQVAGALGPKTYNSPAEMAMEGALSGNQGLLDSAAEADTAMRAGEMAGQQKQMDFQAEQADLNRRHAEKLEGMKLGNTKKKLQQADVEFGTNVKSAITGIAETKKTVQKFGSFELLDPTAKAQLQQSFYDLAIQYAKIADPSSVAREGEVEAAQKYLLPNGWETRTEVTLAALEGLQKRIRERFRARRESQIEMSGQDSGLTVDGRPGGGTAPSAGQFDINKYLK